MMSSLVLQDLKIDQVHQSGVESQIFFVYDHTVLKREEDDLKDAIVYFFPSSVSVDDQCALCGQLMGMVEFFKNFAKTPPKLFVLCHNKFAVRHLGRFTLALAGNIEEADSVVVRQLDYLYKLFVFYHGSLEQVNKRCEDEKGDFLSEVQNIFGSYLPFMRRYGDSLAATFESQPNLELPLGGQTVYLRASQLLHFCQELPGVIAGCILFKNRVLCSQLDPAISSMLLILKPHQKHFPCCEVSLDYNLPVGVRILKTHLSADVHNDLLTENCPMSKTAHESRDRTSRDLARDETSVHNISGRLSPGMDSQCDSNYRSRWRRKGLRKSPAEVAEDRSSSKTLHKSGVVSTETCDAQKTALKTLQSDVVTTHSSAGSGDVISTETCDAQKTAQKTLQSDGVTTRSNAGTGDMNSAETCDAQKTAQKTLQSDGVTTRSNAGPGDEKSRQYDAVRSDDKTIIFHQESLFPAKHDGKSIGANLCCAAHENRKIMALETTKNTVSGQLPVLASEKDPGSNLAALVSDDMAGFPSNHITVSEYGSPSNHIAVSESGSPSNHIAVSESSNTPQSGSSRIDRIQSPPVSGTNKTNSKTDNDPISHKCPVSVTTNIVSTNIIDQSYCKRCHRMKQQQGVVLSTETCRKSVTPQAEPSSNHPHCATNLNKNETQNDIPWVENPPGLPVGTEEGKPVKRENEIDANSEQTIVNDTLQTQCQSLVTDDLAGVTSDKTQCQSLVTDDLAGVTSDKTQCQSLVTDDLAGVTSDKTQCQSLVTDDLAGVTSDKTQCQSLVTDDLPVVTSDKTQCQSLVTGDLPVVTSDKTSLDSSAHVCPCQTIVNDTLQTQCQSLVTDDLPVVTSDKTQCQSLVTDDLPVVTSDKTQCQSLVTDDLAGVTSDKTQCQSLVTDDLPVVTSDKTQCQSLVTDDLAGVTSDKTQCQSLVTDDLPVVTSDKTSLDSSAHVCPCQTGITTVESNILTPDNKCTCESNVHQPSAKSGYSLDVDTSLLCEKCGMITKEVNDILPTLHPGNDPICDNCTKTFTNHKAQGSVCHASGNRPSLISQIPLPDGHETILCTSVKSHKMNIIKVLSGFGIDHEEGQRSNPHSDKLPVRGEDGLTDRLHGPELAEKTVQNGKTPCSYDNDKAEHSVSDAKSDTTISTGNNRNTQNPLDTLGEGHLQKHDITLNLHSEEKSLTNTASLFRNLKKVVAKNINALENKSATGKTEKLRNYSGNDERLNKLYNLDTGNGDVSSSSIPIETNGEGVSNDGGVVQDTCMADSALTNLSDNASGSDNKKQEVSFTDIIGHMDDVREETKSGQVEDNDSYHTAYGENDGERHTDSDGGDINKYLPSVCDKPDCNDGKDNNGTASGDQAGILEPGSRESDTVESALYVQGNSDMLLVLVMEKNTSSDMELVQRLWRTTLTELGELDAQLKDLLGNKPTKKGSASAYNYLTFDNFTKNLSGKISVIGDPLRPMSAQDNEFCETAALMHEEFRKSHLLTDLTLRNQTTCVYGHRSHSQEVFFQSKDQKPYSGVPSSRDTTMSVDVTAFQKLLHEQDIHLI